jgi:hypothetical protein
MGIMEQVLPGKLMAAQRVNRFSSFNGICRFITVKFAVVWDVTSCGLIFENVSKGFAAFFRRCKSVTRTGRARKKLVPTYLPNLGYAVAQLVEALRYKTKGRGFDYRWSHWNISVT